MSTHIGIAPGTCNKQKARRSRHNEKTGKYVKQFARTAANKIRKRARFLRKFGG